MIDNAYLSYSEGKYEAAPQRRSKKPSLAKRLKVTLFIVIPKVVYVLLACLVVIMWEFIQLLLPKKKKSVKGQVALVTGGGNGLGRALCMRLAKEGCSVAVCDIDLPNAEKTAKDIWESYGVKAKAFRADVGDESSIAELRKNIEATLGPVDILVNNAGLLAFLSLSQGSTEDVKRIFDVNLMSHIWALREFKPGMYERRRGHIVAISSILSVLTSARSISYNVTKAGVKTLMTSLREEIILDGLGDCVFTTCAYPTGILSRKDFYDLMKSMKISVPYLTPERCAGYVIDAMLINQMDVIPGFFPAKLAFYLFPLVPASLARMVTNQIVGKVPELMKSPAKDAKQS
ncbi:estradiol 17-beta-dehydrogenase 11-like [Uranotaenia lowii]|uniref:estradiol 17-beta-dehydrogenase 11-like n=1 Tax=Uranotaenia lowii TaxID=190385 RepID=UPI00247970F4|nr:estradiol 17-beta-dehydrogenase 11-like [Uranotaenia lowii]